MKARLAVLGLVVAAATIATPLTAAADPLPPGGEFVIDDARWVVDEYGLASGLDAAGFYAGASIYYPGYLYGTYGNDSYLVCSDAELTADVTYEANGDITIQCARYEVGGMAGVYATFQVRLYSASNGSYLTRTLVTIENTTETDLSFPLSNGWYSLGPVSIAPSTLVTDSGASTVQATDAWFTAGGTDGQTLIQTSAWARPGQTAAAGIVAGSDNPIDYVWADYTGLVYPAGTTTRLLSFTTMVIPATPTPEDATAALAVARSQATEFSTFCGRLVEGLDPAVDYLGWGVPAACNPAPAPLLPATGAGDSDQVAMAVAALVLIAGAAALVAARRRRPV